MAILMAAGVLAQQGDRAPIDTAPPPAHWKIPPAPLRTPAESMAHMELPPGFRVELVAAEPLVQDPIAFAFDEHDGRLWVLEWPAYNWELRPNLPGVEAGAPRPPGRLVVLRDEDGDGVMDRRSVFAELDWPRGLQPIAGGILVFALPEVVFLTDSEGDDKADRREVLYGELPIPANPHAAPSSPAWTIDNWIYGLQTTRRLRHAGGRWTVGEAARLGGQWGLSQDDYGRLFFGYNGDHLRGSLVPVHYAVRNPHHPGAAGTDVRIAQDQTVWPHGITSGVNRRAQLRDDGRLRVFTANAGPSVYRGGRFPPEFDGNVFVAESAGRMIRRVVLEERNGIVTGTNAYHEREFLFSRDERFRPVFTAGGPDGALYIADMYRGIIEGHIFITSFLRGQILDRALHQPFHGHGRIYRIVHDGLARGGAPGRAARTPEGWLPLLAHANGFWRDAAQRAIVSAGDRSVVPALRTMASGGTGELARLHALWTLEGLGAVDREIVRDALGDESFRVRSAAVRIAEPLLEDPAVLSAALQLVDDPDTVVRRQLLFSLGAVAVPAAEQGMLAILARDAGEPFVIDAALSGLAGRELAMLDLVLQTAGLSSAGLSTPNFPASARAEDAPASARPRQSSPRSGSSATSGGGQLPTSKASRPDVPDGSGGKRPGMRELVSALAAAVMREGVPAKIGVLTRRAANPAQPAWQREALVDGITAAGRAQGGPAPNRPDGSVPPEIEQGRALYAICAGCHQADGRGLPELAPPLQGSPRVLGPKEILIDIVLRGRDEDPAYPSMPPLPGLSDDQIAAVLTYIRQAWSNRESAVAPDEVGARR